MGCNVFPNNMYLTIADWNLTYPPIQIPKNSKFICTRAIFHAHRRSEVTIRIINGNMADKEFTMLHNSGCHSPFIVLPDTDEYIAMFKKYNYVFNKQSNG